MSSKVKLIGDFVIEEEVGRGSFSAVFKGFDKFSGENVAVKVISRNKLNRRSMENLESEIAIMRSCHHANIVHLRETKKSEKHIYLVMEFCSGGDLAKWLKKKRIISQENAQFFIRQLANGLRFMKQNNIIHRDLKPQNLLLTSSTNECSSIKIGDFGFAKHLPSEMDMAGTLCGSPLYMAPEILRFERYDGRADLWSVGVILYEMLWGRPPFRAQNHVELGRKLASGAALRFPTFVQLVEKVALGSGENTLPQPQTSVISVQTSDACRDLLQRLLRIDPQERISFDEFYFHPFVWGEGSVVRPMPQLIAAGVGTSQLEGLLRAPLPPNIQRLLRFALRVYAETHDTNVALVAYLLACNATSTEEASKGNVEDAQDIRTWIGAIRNALRQELQQCKPTLLLKQAFVTGMTEVTRRITSKCKNGAINELLGYDECAHAILKEMSDIVHSLSQQLHLRPSIANIDTEDVFGWASDGGARSSDIKSSPIVEFETELEERLECINLRLHSLK